MKDEAIRARRPTLVQRVLKWARRHRALVAIGLAALALTTIVSVASAVLIWHEKEQTQAALHDAEAYRSRAATNLQEALWAIEDTLYAIDPKCNPRPAIPELREYQTETVLRFLAPFCEDQSDRPSHRLQKGAALVHRGRVYQVLGDSEKAQQAFQRAITVYERHLDDFPNDPTHSSMGGLVSVLFILAEDVYRDGRIAEANAYFTRAVAISTHIIHKFPSDFGGYQRLGMGLSMWLDPKLRDPLRAVTALDRALELAPDKLSARAILSVACYRSGQWDRAMKAAVETLNGADPRGTGETSRKLAQLVLAMAQWQLGHHEQAKQTYDQAVRRDGCTMFQRGYFDFALHAEAKALLLIDEPPTSKE